MKRRIAKKVKDDPKRYRGNQIADAAKRLGGYVIGIDMAAEGSTDWTVSHVYKTETGRFASETLNEANKPKTAFNYRTGQAPTTPGAIPVTPFNFEGVDPKIQHAYDGMTLPELRAYAKEHGVKGYSTLKKDELLDLLGRFGQGE
jgi:hypothetical protein